MPTLPPTDAAAEEAADEADEADDDADDEDEDEEDKVSGVSPPPLSKSLESESDDRLDRRVLDDVLESSGIERSHSSN